MRDQTGTNENPGGHETRGRLDRFSTRSGLVFLAMVSFLLLALAAVGIWYVLDQLTSGVGRTVQIQPPASIEELIETYPELAPILENSELDSVYKDFFMVYQEGGEEAALDMARSRGMLSQDDELRMTLELDTDDSAELASELERRGIKVTAASGNVMDIAIPLSIIEAAIEAGEPARLFQGLAGLEHIVRIRLPRIGLQDAGATGLDSLEDVGAAAWQNQGFSGDGIRIGVLDMGFNHYKDLLGSDLPDSVTARSFIYGSAIDETETAHGTACAEIIHDIAPGAELIFAAYETDAEQRQAIEWLLTQNVDIISHSAGSIYGPMDGTGFEARLVDNIVDDGIVWINSAGNSGETHYRAVFTDETGNGFHEFTPDDEMMGFIPDGFVVMVLNWDDWGGGVQDFDLYVIDEDQEDIAVSENIRDSSNDDAAEIIRYNFSDDGPYYIAFFGRNVTHPVTLNFFIYDAIIEYSTADYSITTPADAENAIAVGATFWSDDLVETYSSRGPTVDGRLKPDISAPAGVSVTVNDKPFFGTSASAPHVAGAAALILEAFPEFHPTDVETFLLSRAIDLGSGGPDYEYGYGRLWLGEAPEIVDTEPQVTNTSQAPEATTTPTEVDTLDPTDTPTIVENPIDEPSTSSNSLGATEVILICACVGIPGLLGLTGVGIIIGILLYRRSIEQSGRAHAVQPKPVYMPPPVQIPDAGSAQEPLDSGSVCPRCQSPHASDAQFCNYCGYKLSPRRSDLQPDDSCRKCGATLRESAKFCPNCGHPR